jgi:2-dehydro-3-deoxygluconokinase
MYDVVTIGETMLRFTPGGGLRWVQAQQFDLHIGGSESNLAVGLSRLGHRVAWISRLTDNPFGRKIAQQISAEGVDTSHVVWTDQDRIGLYFFEQGSPPRENRVIYDRAGSSYSQWSFEDLPRQIFVPGFARYLHVSGISLGLGSRTQKLIMACVERAKEAGWSISFDINFRAKLWSAEQAREVCEQLAALADVVFLPIRDARTVWQINYDVQQLQLTPSESSKAVIEQFASLVPAANCVMTLGELGACTLCRGQFDFATTRAVTAIGRLGGGDAFAAGFLSGLLRYGTNPAALRWGNAAAQVKYSITGDLPLFEYAEVASIADGVQSQNSFR